MGIIPLLVVFCLIVSRNYENDFFIVNETLIIVIAVAISIIGFFYAYGLIAALTKKLLTYSYERKQADEDKSAFVANIVHEFRNPLIIIRDSLGFLFTDAPGKMNSEKNQILDGVKRNISRLLRLTTDFLYLSKIETGKITIVKEKINPAALLSDILETYETEFSKKQITLNMDISEDAGSIWANTDRLNQIIINLLNNAVRCTPEKGTIVIKFSGDKHEIRCEISDNGPGLTDDDCKKIFNKFERINTERREGSGMGLPIAKDIVNLHKGKIWVESKVNEGTKFIFTLPRDTRAQNNKR